MRAPPAHRAGELMEPRERPVDPPRVAESSARASRASHTAATATWKEPGAAPGERMAALSRSAPPYPLRAPVPPPMTLIEEVEEGP